MRRFGAVVLAGLASLAGSSPTGAAPGVWTRVASPVVQPPPSRAEAVTFGRGISCLAGGFCAAVGQVDRATGLQGDFEEAPVTELRRGGAWSAEIGAFGDLDAPGGLVDVSCVSGSFCMAVGYQLTERWDGSVWTPAGAADTDWSGVSCVSTTFCVAVGSGSMGTAIDMWNGAAWTPMLDPAEPSGSVLRGVSCVSITFCAAVGNEFRTWNGVLWQPSHAPDTAAIRLSRVSCPTAKFCLASGRGVWTWNGVFWQRISNPGGGQLDGVSCRSATTCVLVGYTTGANFFPQPLAEVWDGTSLRVVGVPAHPTGDPSLAPAGELEGVSCTAVTSCRATGYYYLVADGKETTQTLMTVWNGSTWRLDQEPATAFTTPANGVLVDVSCASSAWCVAVGSYRDSVTRLRTLAETWNGSSWSVVPTPNLEPATISDDRIDQVSCISSSSCIAVGHADDPTSGGRGKFATFVERWNGATWSTAYSVTGDYPSSPPQFSGLSCVSSTFCVAVDGLSGATFHWNGAILAFVSHPAGTLADVSCVSPTDCTAVGQGGSQAVVQHWNGGAWSAVAIPTPGGAHTSLAAVACSSSTSCLAVGVSVASASSVLYERWDGVAWSIVSGPSPSTDSNSPTSITCVSATSCEAVGDYRDTGSFQHPWAVSWDGTQWSTTPTDVSVTNYPLNGVSCGGPGSCFAVGAAGNALDQTLIEAKS